MLAFVSSRMEATPQFSDVGSRLSRRTGIHELMEDLGAALADPGVAMMGGGSPAHIPEVEAAWEMRVRAMLEGPAMLHALGDYDGPRGKEEFLESFAQYLRSRFGWEIGRDNLAVTSGSQTAMFLLLNLLAGKSGDTRRKILFPLLPEYIGYADQGLEAGSFVGQPARIEFPAVHRMKYHIDFDALECDSDVAAICLSRPTNPSGNVVGDEELGRLLTLAEARGVYLINDNAYGEPFPRVLFRDARPPWSPWTIHTFSLSKLGLPGTRTGIVAAPVGIASAIARMNSNLALASPSPGQMIVAPMLGSGEIDRLCDTVIRPYYARRAAHALEALEDAFAGKFDYRIHESEGAFFLWVWFPELRCGDQELYGELKRRGLLVVPGSLFGPGLGAPWKHLEQCLRLSFGGPEDSVERGAKILATTVGEHC